VALRCGDEERRHLLANLSLLGSHRQAAKSWGVDVPEGKDAHNLLYFDPQMRAIYKNWLRIMLTEKNPYTALLSKMIRH
jgi:hypothetical protein